MIPKEYQNKDLEINSLWLQKCGDSIKIIEKTNLKNKSKNYLYKGIFLKYPYEIITTKREIVEGRCQNPLIEQNEFCGKLYPQNCGDILYVIKKTEEKDNWGKFKFLCEFQKYPYKLLCIKGSILKGTVLNPRIEQEEFIGKEFKQNCGDILKVLRKTEEKQGYQKHFLYEVEFIKYPCKLLKYKADIIGGRVDNPKLPWRNKEDYKNFILNNFPNKKPTIIELAQKLGISRQEAGRNIIDYNLQNYIHYNYGKSENELKQYIQNLLNIDSIKSNCTILKNYKEIDIYIPDLKLGFEFNGNYWHSDLFKKSNYHQNKSLEALNKGVRLIHIWEYELNNKNLLKSFIKTQLGIFDKKIGASKCKIKELDYKTYAAFCNKNHLQGECGAGIKLGLFYKDELIQIMSFGTPRFTNNFDYEIIRECSKQGYCIIGGKTKLWSYFLKKYHPNSVISYCDFSKFTGESYLKLGFKKERLNKPGFVWWDKNIGEIFNRNPSHHQKMKEKGYYKIYDAGQLVFTYYNL
jgi:hypothetical protein